MIWQCFPQLVLTIQEEAIDYIGGFFPVVANAFIIPLVIVFLCGDLSATEILGWGESTVTFAYWANCISLLITEAVWVYCHRSKW